MRIPDKHIGAFKALSPGGSMTIPWEDVGNKAEVRPTTLRDGPRETRLWEVKPTDAGVEVKRVK